MQTVAVPIGPLIQLEILPRTPITSEGLSKLCIHIDQDIAGDYPSKAGLKKLVYAAEKAFADRSLLLDENRLLFEQNNEKVTRCSMRSTITGTTKVMTYDDIIAAERQRDAKVKGKRQKPPTERDSTGEL